MKAKLLCLNLKLFDGGAAAGASAGGAEAGTPSAQAVSQPATGEKTKVVYGKPDTVEAPKVETPITPVAGEKSNSTSDTLEAKRAEFEKLVNGDYKDMFTERMQSVIDRRFKETKGLQEQLKGYQPIAQILADKYGVDPNDAKALSEAIEKDDRYWEEAAEESGMTVDQYKQMKKLERENSQFRDMMRQKEQESFANETFARWQQDGEALKQTYPDFSLEIEAQNPDFVRLLKSNVSMQKAYEVVHMDDIKANVAQTVGKQVESNMASTIKAKGNRPAEAGANPMPGIVVKNDVSQLTAADRKEIALRASRGEAIRF